MLLPPSPPLRGRGAGGKGPAVGSRPAPEPPPPPACLRLGNLVGGRPHGTRDAVAILLPGPGRPARRGTPAPARPAGGAVGREVPPRLPLDRRARRVLPVPGPGVRAAPAAGPRRPARRATRRRELRLLPAPAPAHPADVAPAGLCRRPRPRQ